MLLRWCALNRDETRRCTRTRRCVRTRRCMRTQRCAMEREDAGWNAKMRDGTRRCAMEREDAWWNTKMRSETWRCTMEHEDAWECEDAREREDAWWNVKMHGETRRCTRMRAKHERRNALRECGKVSWVWHVIAGKLRIICGITLHMMVMLRCEAQSSWVIK
jgi:hypothetical protein